MYLNFGLKTGPLLPSQKLTALPIFSASYFYNILPETLQKVKIYVISQNFIEFNVDWFKLSKNGV